MQFVSQDESNFSLPLLQPTMCLLFHNDKSPMRLLTVFELRTSTQGYLRIYRWACTCIYITKFSTGEESSGFVFLRTVTQQRVLPKPPVTRAPSQLFSWSHTQLYNPHPWYCHVWFFGFGNCCASFLSLSPSLSLTSLCAKVDLISLCTQGFSVSCLLLSVGMHPCLLYTSWHCFLLMIFVDLSASSF